MRDCAFSADKTLGRLETIDARAGSLHALAQIFGNYVIVPSHSVSRVTVEQRVTVESAAQTPQAGEGGQHGIL